MMLGKDESQSDMEKSRDINDTGLSKPQIELSNGGNDMETVSERYDRQLENGLVQSAGLYSDLKPTIATDSNDLENGESGHLLSPNTAKTVRIVLGDGDGNDFEDELTPPLAPHPKSSTASVIPVTNLGDFSIFGYYTVFIIILSELTLLPQMFSMTFMVYGGYAPRPTTCGSHVLPVDAQIACKALSRLMNETGCRPTFETQFESVAYEFGYYCDSMVHVKRSISAQLFGVLLGALVFGQLSDAFGRRRVMLIAHVGMLVFGCAAVLASRSLLEFTVLQFAALFFVGGHNTTMHVFLVENLPKRYRIIVMMLISYSPNYIILAAVSYLTHEWRAQLMVNSLLNIPAFLILLLAWESPRWLIHSGQLERARTALTTIERFNGTDTLPRMKAIDDIIEHEVKLNETKKKNRKYYLYHLFYTMKMARHICVICLALMSTSMLAYALLFNMEHLSGSLYLNSALFGLLRYSMNLGVGILDYFVPRVGRKVVFNGALAFILVMLAIMALCKVVDFDTSEILRVTTICAAAMCSQLFMINGVVSSELFPTAVRNLASSLGQAWNRIGAIIAPHVFYLALSWAPLPYLLLLSLMTVVMVLFTAVIPETKHAPLADHMPARHERVFVSRSLKRKSFLRMDVAPSAACLTEDC